MRASRCLWVVPAVVAVIMIHTRPVANVCVRVWMCVPVCVPVNCPIWRARADAASAALMCEQQKSKPTKYERIVRLRLCRKGVWQGASMGGVLRTVQTLNYTNVFWIIFQFHCRPRHKLPPVSACHCYISIKVPLVLSLDPCSPPLFMWGYAASVVLSFNRYSS